MVSRRLPLFSGTLLAVALVSGTWSDVPLRNPPLTLGGYRVLAADLHVHEYPLSAGTLAPWDLAIEASRQGLDVIAVTGHNYVQAGLAGRWFSRLAGGPIVLAGEEIHGPEYHMIALGIHQTISWRGTAEQSIDEIHRQGGLAIAAHPAGKVRSAYSDAALRKLDGAEVMQPVVFNYVEGAAQLRQFFELGHFAAIGSSDFHGMGPLGFCRTYIFARDASEPAIMEALRAHRTLVYDAGGTPYGDTESKALAAQYGRLREREPTAPSSGLLNWLSRICAVLGMLGLILSKFRSSPGVYSAR